MTPTAMRSVSLVPSQREPVMAAIANVDAKLWEVKKGRAGGELPKGGASHLS